MSEERSRQAFPGIPSIPPQDIEFTDSPDDETCPRCGWDAEQVWQDRHQAHAAGVLLAVEVENTPVYASMAGMLLIANYLRCPNMLEGSEVNIGGPELEPCGTFFTIEEENHTGAMA